MANNVVKIVLQGVDNASAALRAPIHSLDDLKKSLTALAGPAKLFSTAMAGAAVAATAAFSKASLGAAEQMRRIETSLRVGTGSAEAAAREMQFLKDVSNTLGLELFQTGRAFSQLSAAAQGTSLQGEETRQVFIGLAMAGNALGLTADQLEGAIYAVQQMVSKGRVTAEELNQQLGDRLPGAVKIAERAVGLFGQEFQEALRAGKLSADQFLPAFGRELQRTFGEQSKEAAGSYTAQMNRITNAMNEVKITMGQALMPEFLKLASMLLAATKNMRDFSSAAEVLLTILDGVARGVMAAGTAFVQMGKNVAVGPAALFEAMKGNFTVAKQVIADALKETEESAGKIKRLMTESFLGKPSDITAPGIELPAPQAIEPFKLADAKVSEAEASRVVDAISAQYQRLHATKMELLDIEESEEQDRIIESKARNEQKEVALYQLAAIYGEKRAQLAREISDAARKEFEKAEEDERRRNEESIERERQKILEIQSLQNQFKLDNLIGIEREIEAERQRFEQQLDQINQLLPLEEEARTLREQAEEAHRNRLSQIREASAKRDAANERLMAQSRIRAFGDMFGAMAQISQTFGKKNAVLYKAFSSAQALISAYLAATNILAQPHLLYPFNMIAANVTLAAGLANVAAINAAPTGIAHGGMDYVPAETSYILNRGERVVSPRQNEDLTNFLEGGVATSQPTMIEILLDGEILGRGLGRMSKDGRLTIHAGAIA